MYSKIHRSTTNCRGRTTHARHINWHAIEHVNSHLHLWKFTTWGFILGDVHITHSLSHFSRVRLCVTIDGSPRGSPVPGILQARTLECVAISFSNAGKWKVKGKSLSRVRFFPTPWTAAYQAPPSMGFFQARVLEWGAIAFSIHNHK